MALPQRDALHHTYADYLTWPEDLRYELIDGVAYMVTPAPSRPHQEIVGEIHRQSANALQGKHCRAYVAPFDVRLPKGGQADGEIDTVVRAGVPEVWLIHPTDRVLTIYRLEAARYGRPVISELKGQTPVSSVPDLSIDWDRLLAQLDG
jgi:Uma2 family endonuclease